MQEKGTNKQKIIRKNKTASTNISHTYFAYVPLTYLITRSTIRLIVLGTWRIEK